MLNIEESLIFLEGEHGDGFYEKDETDDISLNYYELWKNDDHNSYKYT